MKVYEGLALALVEEGIDTVFGLIGGGVDLLVYELVEKHGVRYIPARHEEAAVGMADGYSRATGKIGVAIVAYGPGIAKVGATLIAANMARSSVLVICGDTQDRLNPMNFDQYPYLKATAGTVQQIREPRTLEEDVQLTFRHLRLGKGPIALSMGNFGSSLDSEDWSYDAQGLSQVARRTALPEPSEIETVARLLENSKRPVLLAGKGAVLAGAKEEIVALAERTGAVLATSLLAKGWFRGHSRNIGLAGRFGSFGTLAILADADLVVAFGAGLNQLTTGQGKLFPDATVVQIDTNPERIGSITPVQHAVVADARETAAALLRAVAPGNGWADAGIDERIAAIDPWEGIDFSETTGYVNPHAASRMCEELLPRDRLLVIDVGQFMGIPATHISTPGPLDLVFPWQLGLMGTGLSVALGAAVARPERRTVLFAGDGGLMASLNDLDTAARCDIPLTILVMDDSGFGAERRIYRDGGRSLNLANYENPDIAAAARALGLQGFLATNLDELRTALNAVNESTRPTLIQVKVHPDARFDEMRRYHS